MKPSVIRYIDYKEPEFFIEKTTLEFDIFEDFTIVSSKLEFKKLDKTAQHLALDAMELELLELKLDERDVTNYAYSDEKLTIKDVGDEFVLKIKNKIYPHKNSDLEGLYKSNGMFCTQNEPEGFRKITPYLDRPDVLSIYTTTIKAYKNYPVLLSNGNLVDSFELSEDRHCAIWCDPFAKPTYLFALVAGDLGVLSDEFITQSGKRVELNIYCDKGNEQKCHFAMKSLKDAMRWDEISFDREYDLELYNIVAVDSFNMGAMENKGLNIFNSHYVLADEQSAVDSDFLGIQSVIAHEYFHNWSGNRVTCKNWFELTLKEGLTVFRDQSFSADLNGYNLVRIMDVKALRERQFSEDASPMAHPIKPDSYIAINNFYTSTIYEKGAEVIRMLSTFMGKERFKKALNLYFETFDGKAVGTDEFLWSIEQFSSIDMELFKRWYAQSRTPLLEVKQSFDDGVFKLTLTQKISQNAEKKAQLPHYYPLKIALFEQNGDEILEQTLTIKDEVNEFSFECEEKPILSINRDFSAPIIVEFDECEYIFLMKHDKNGFSRYEAIHKVILQNLQNILQNKDIDERFLDAYGYILDEEIDSSLKAYMIDIASIESLASMQKSIDFEKLCDARDELKRVLSVAFEQKLLSIYEANYAKDSVELDMQSMAKRALANRALSLLPSATKKDLAKHQYYNSLSMNDKIAALSVLSNQDCVDELEHFYNNYAHISALAQKYFSIIAQSDHSDVLHRVMKLQKDRYYDKNVPNLFRSLIFSFSKNHRYFHAKDGSGYRFVASEIVAMDDVNAQMASSLASSSFKVYPRLSSANKIILKQELEFILSHDNISKNLYEVISKIISN